MWWQAIGKRLRSTLKGQLMKSILAFGDSNTWGLVPGSKTLERYPDTVRWTGILQKSVSDTRIIEEGLCGRTTVFEDALRPGRKGVASLSISLESQCPVDAVILMLGTNDCKAFYNVTPETIGLGIEQCVNEIEKYISPEKILLISPIQLGADVWKPEKDPEFDRSSVETSRCLKGVYSRIAGKYKTAFLAASDYARADEADDEHLNEEGHRQLANAVLTKLNEMEI